MSDVPVWVWATLVGLLLLSGFFSSSETALFSLSHRQRARVEGRVRKLLARPRSLLVTVLLCNLVVNVLFFAFADRLTEGAGELEGVFIGIGVLVSLLVCGEILPKTLGLRARLWVAQFTSPVLRILVGLFGVLAAPLVRVLEVVGGWVERLLGDRRGITSEMLAQVMERGEEEGTLDGTEADLLAEVVELDDIRVREIMHPRVDTRFAQLDGSDREEAVREALANRHSWLPVIDGDPDRVVGRVHLRDLLKHPGRTVRRLVMPVKFVPEMATALDLLRSFHEDRTEEAVVVDEWGGTAGIVTGEDVFEEIVGELRQEDEHRIPAAVPLGENRYRVAGGLSVRDWNEEFGQGVVPWEYETVGGLVTALLGRIPREGDRVRIGTLEMQVHEVRGRRVLAVDVWVSEPAGEEGER